MSFASTYPFAVGDFRITPLSRFHGSDQHTALLSIKSGQGSQTHDRVYTFKPEFSTQQSALMYAAAQGRNWLWLAGLNHDFKEALWPRKNSLK